MRKYGVKLWSRDFANNSDFALQSVKAVKEGYFDYIELFVPPHTYDDYYKQISNEFTGLKVIIHAPHSVFGFDTGDREMFPKNQEKLKASQQYADLLGAEIIILHAGFNEGERYVEESAYQFKNFNEPRLVVENLPRFCSSTQKILHGTSPLEIKKIMDISGCGFCLDFSHAICASNYYQRDKLEDLRAYQSLKPKMYHMCDGDWRGDVDEHLHYGEGNYPLSELLNNYTNTDTYITMETGHGIPTTIQPWLDDITNLRKLSKK